jgi:hypothetical protein
MHHTLCDYLLDITQNGVEAGANSLTVSLFESEKKIEMKVEDNGCGMSEDTLKKAIDPFFTDPKKHSARKAGFGLPFLIQATETCGGEFSIKSKEGEGTTISCFFDAENIDTPPIGNIAITVVTLMTLAEEYELLFERKTKNDEYQVSRSDLLEALGDLQTASSLKLAKDYLISLEDN